LLPTVTQLLAPLAEVDDRGVRSIDGPMVSWRQHIQDGAALAALLRSRLDPDRPPHVGVLLGNTPLFSALLVAAGLGGVVPVGLNPTRRGAALRRDITHADCQLVLTDTTPDSYQGAFPEGTPVLDVGTTEWADELDSCTGAPVRFADSAADDLFMLIFTSGTGGDPKAVRCTHEKVAVPGVMLAERFGLTPEDVFYLSMPLFHSNAIMAGWAPAVAAGGGIVLRRRFSASAFIDDARRFRAVLYPRDARAPRRRRQHAADHVRQRGGTPRHRPVRAAIRCDGRRRLRFLRGRNWHRPHPGHPRGFTRPTHRGLGDSRRRDRVAVPTRRGR
jgi:fatty-acyl-CoA synthase